MTTVNSRARAGTPVSEGGFPEAGFDLDTSLVEDLDINCDLADLFRPTAFKIKEMEGKLEPEPLLQEDKTRFVLFPIKQPDVSCPFQLQYIFFYFIHNSTH